MFGVCFTDSVDTKSALDEVRELIKASNVYISKHRTDKTLPNRMLLQNIASFTTNLLKVSKTWLCTSVPVIY